MRRIDRLKQEAKDGCNWRGHNMSRFYNGESVCKTCKATVNVDAKPAPNGIDIAGPAIALDCSVKESEN